MGGSDECVNALAVGILCSRFETLHSFFPCRPFSGGVLSATLIGVGFMDDSTAVSEEIRTLRKEQVQRFDKDFISDERFAGICACIDRDFPSGVFRFLDVGGGIGAFADRLLERYPEANGHVLDNSEPLLSRNVQHPRKVVQLGSIEDAPHLVAARGFDIVFFNYSLHHFVVDSYRRTRKVQRRAISDAASLLKSSGRLSIVENLCDGYIPPLSGLLIFTLTSSKMLAPLVKRLGAKTAGTGICYLDRRSWEREINQANFQVTAFAADSKAPKWGFIRKLLLLIRDLRGGHYWAKSQSEVGLTKSE